MRDILCQTRRGVKSIGFLISVLLMLYSLHFAHVNAPVSLDYFRFSSFYYHFMISFINDFNRYALPIAAVLPLCFFLDEDKSSGFILYSQHRCGKWGYLFHRAAAAVISAMLAILTASLIYTFFLLIVCPVDPAARHNNWMEAAQKYTYTWRALPENFLLFVIEQLIRFMLSAGVWALVALGFSAIHHNRMLVLVMTFLTSVLLHNHLAYHVNVEYTLSLAQMPEPHSLYPLAYYWQVQLIYLGTALAFALLMFLLRFSAWSERVTERTKQFFLRKSDALSLSLPLFIPKRLRGRGIGLFLTDFIAFFNAPALLTALFIPPMVAASTFVIRQAVFSAGDLMVATLGGFGWFTTGSAFEPVGPWVLLMMPPMVGVAINLQRELSPRKFITLNRFGGKQRWWLSKCAASALSTLLYVAVMFLSTALFAWLVGARGLSVTLQDAEGFLSYETRPLWLMFLLVAGQALMLTQLQCIVHMISGSMVLGAACYLLPMIGCLIHYSLFDHPAHMNNPYNWGMLLKTLEFGEVETFGVIEGVPDRSNFLLPGESILKEFLVFLSLFGLSSQLIRPIPVSERACKQ